MNCSSGAAQKARPYGRRAYGVGHFSRPRWAGIINAPSLHRMPKPMTVIPFTTDRRSDSPLCAFGRAKTLGKPKTKAPVTPAVDIFSLSNRCYF